MGKKYIIEIPEDKIADFVGSTHFLMPYMMAGHIGHHDTGLPIEPYTELDLEKVKKEAYQQGYEQGYKDGYNEPDKGKIQVGDEVIRHYKSEFAEGDDAPSIFLSEEDGYFRCLAFNGRSIMIAEYPKNQYRKTGRHFPEIAEVLQKIKESDNG